MPGAPPTLRQSHLAPPRHRRPAGFGAQGGCYLRFFHAGSIDSVQQAVARIRRFLERRND